MIRSLRLTAAAVFTASSIAMITAEAATAQSRSQIETHAPAVPAPRTISYGPDARQAVDFWLPAAPADARRPPLIVFVHGGAWSMGSKANGTGQWKEAHFLTRGYALASVDYRLVPFARVEDQASDVAKALRVLISRADALGFDPHRVVLMGHSAGAHLVALVSTDPAYLAQSGLSLSDITGTVDIDGAGYDVPEEIGAARPLLRHAYEQAFGTDPSRQRALSPVFHAAAPNVGHFLLLHVDRLDSATEADELAEALRQSGAKVQVNGFAGKGLAGHMTINRRLGDPDYPATSVVDSWLDSLLRP